jgi:hypothetical protein
MDDKIPLYWKQKETRRRQIYPGEENSPPREKTRPDLRKNLIKEIREAEERQIREHGRKKTPPENIIIFIGVLVVIVIFLFLFKNPLFNSNQVQDINEESFNKETYQEQSYSYEIRTERYFVVIINNEEEDLNIEIEYNRYSEALGINEDKTMQVYVPGNDEATFKDPEFSRNTECMKNDCTVSIISSRII